MITVDASILVAHFSLGDEDRGWRNQTLVAHPLTFAEVLVGGVRTGREQEMLVALGRLQVQEAEPPRDEPLLGARYRADAGGAAGDV